VSAETFEDVLQKPVPKRFWWALAVLIFAVGACALAWQVALAVERAQMQTVLDQQCGVGKVSVDDGGFGYDPIYTWDSPHAACYQDVSTRAWVCSCNTSP
jgi:hypothetical protein